MIPPLAALALAALPSATPASLAPGDRLAPFEIATREGAPFSWRPGDETVITFCAFWCDTWRTQLPRVAEARRALQGLPIRFLTVSVDGRWTDVARHAAVGTMLSDRGGRWISAIGVDRVPTTLVVAPDGTIRWASFGTLRTQDLIDAIRRPAESAGTVYLTFDDFPPPQGGDDLLDALRAAKVPATLFCIGADAAARPDVVRRAAAEGHRLEIHSWSHDAARPDLPRCQALLARLAGAKPDLYRPPGSETLLRIGGGPLRLPVVDPYDYTRPGTSELVRRVLQQARPNAVIQLHAGVDDTVRALPEIVGNLRRRGYRFELLR